MTQRLLLASFVLLALACGAQPEAERAPKPVSAPAATPPPPPRPAPPPPAAPPPEVAADVAPSAPAAPLPPAAASAALLDPSKAVEKAPAKFRVKFTTTKGDFVIEAHRDWAPNGVDRFYNLARIGFFTDLAFFRAVKGFMIQFGIPGDPKVAAKWREARIQDDSVLKSNQPGFVTFATSGPNARTTQLFINTVSNDNLDRLPQQFAPFGQVVEGMDVVNKLHTGYGEGAPGGRGPSQGRVQTEGNAYLRKDFPELDYIKSATILP